MKPLILKNLPYQFDPKILKLFGKLIARNRGGSSENGWNGLLTVITTAIRACVLSFLCRTENLIIQWALENVLIEIWHETEIAICI